MDLIEMRRSFRLQKERVKTTYINEEMVLDNDSKSGLVTTLNDNGIGNLIASLQNRLYSITSSLSILQDSIFPMLLMSVRRAKQ